MKNIRFAMLLFFATIYAFADNGYKEKRFTIGIENRVKFLGLLDQEQVVNEMEKDRRGICQTVYPVEYPAMPGDQRPARRRRKNYCSQRGRTWLFRLMDHVCYHAPHLKIHIIINLDRFVIRIIGQEV